MGHNIDILNIKPSYVQNPYLAYGIGMVKVPFIFRNIKADLLLADNLESGMVALWLKTLFNVPFVFDFIDDYTLIAGYDGGIWRYRYLSILEKRIPRFADSVIVVTEEMRDFCHRLGVQDNSLEVIPNGVDVDLFFPTPKQGGLKSLHGLKRGQVVLFRGKMNSYYRLDQVLTAIPMVLKAFPETQFLMVGDGKNLGDLKALSQSLGIEGSVFFSGMVPLAELPTYINLADICLYPLPNVTALAVLEYAACSKPVIIPKGGTEKIGISHELVRKNAVLLVDDSPKGFAQGIKRLLGNPELGKQMGESAMKIAVTQYRWKSLTERYEKVLTQAYS
ncbi:glycosyltransferase family 4 protein [Gammaproteobacteria bacterium]|nr:glycosyltransferase family 4 protein [Gammaproteobacteria bacterium]